MSQPLQKLRDYVQQHELAISGILLALVLGIAGIWAIWKVPKLQVQHAVDAAREEASKQLPATTGAGSPARSSTLAEDYTKQLELEDNFRKTLVQALGGAFFLLGFYYTAKTFGLSRQGQITDRFTKAIEQLGKADANGPIIEVRLGAIYALERIAFDSPRDHWTIMEILTAYVRQNAPTRPDTPFTKGETLRTDIQAILTVLGRRKTSPKRERPGQHLDLSSSNLNGVKLPPAANLQGALLREANLQGAFSVQANLQGAHLEEANLQDASLIQANLQGAGLDEANLRDAYLNAANLESAGLGRANLQGANLTETNLQNAYLSGASLEGALFSKANLQGAVFTQANLQGAYLDEANLQGANLMLANLRDAYFHAANLREADLLDAKYLTIEQVKAATNWNTARYSAKLQQKLDLPPEGSGDSSSH